MTMRMAIAWALIAGPVLTGTSVAGEKTQSYPAQKGGILQVRADGGEIAVKGWEKDEVYIRVTSLDEEQLKQVSISQSGGKVLVRFDWGRKNMEEIRFEIKVPSLFNVDLRTGGGEISLAGPLNGNLKGSTGGGSIMLGDVGGTIQMETAGGEIAGGNIVGNLSLRTGGGDIKVKSIAGGGDISTAGGSVDIGTASEPVQVSTAGGDIRFGKADQDARLTTAGGNITFGTGQGHITMNTAGGSISMVSGRGWVEASTAAGNVRLDKVEGQVFARSSGGNVSVMLDPKAGESSSVATSAGNVTLRIPETAKATIRARTRGLVVDFDEDEGDDFIRSDFPVTRPDGRRNGGEAEVILNGGGHRISLETTIGTIEIRKPK